MIELSDTTGVLGIWGCNVCCYSGPYAKELRRGSLWKGYIRLTRG